VCTTHLAPAVSRVELSGIAENHNCITDRSPYLVEGKNNPWVRISLRTGRNERLRHALLAQLSRTDESRLVAVNCTTAVEEIRCDLVRI